ncbi:MAG: hypothetical protein H0X61_15315, partial [Acidimicrobiia bacterium]|nr:hypothetical protein [Acidimicrobiia bacterium]
MGGVVVAGAVVAGGRSRFRLGFVDSVASVVSVATVVTGSVAGDVVAGGDAVVGVVAGAVDCVGGS